MAVKKFFKILSIEFSDLEEDFENSIASLEDRYRRQEITEHIMKENSQLLRRELTDLLIIHKRIMEFSPEDFRTIEEATQRIIKEIYSFTGIPEAVHSYMEKRVRKVLRYLDEVC